MSHFGLLLLAVIAKESVTEQFQLGVRLFGGFVAAGYVLGWVMLALPF
jgi:hypothetical protein